MDLDELGEAERSTSSYFNIDNSKKIGVVLLLGNINQNFRFTDLNKFGLIIEKLVLSKTICWFV